MTDRDFWDGLDPKYKVILCDVWGTLHDGVTLFPGVTERLLKWRSDGRFVLLITNAPRPAEAVAEQLGRLGLARECWSAIATSGEAGIEALNALGHPVGFVGTREDRNILEGRGVEIASNEDAKDIACTGLEERRPRVEDYRSDLQCWSARGVKMHCLNPDRVVVFNGVPEPCAGAIADDYEAIGGQVCWYGKPFEPIYRHALHVAGDPATSQVLAVGDGLETDMRGAARFGLDAVFVTSGVNAGDPFPEDLGRQVARPGWLPLGTVKSLG